MFVFLLGERIVIGVGEDRVADKERSAIKIALPCFTCNQLDIN